jgi:peroxiredoxin
VFPYTIYEAPSEHPAELAAIQEFMIGDPSTSPNPLCKHAERLTGARPVLGRTTIRYRCQRNNDSLLGSTILVDQSTGLLLRSGPLHASRVDTSPTVTADTLSTHAPAGAKVDVVAAKHPTGPEPSNQKAPPFRLRLLHGGTVSSSDLVGKPYVLAFFSSDLYFDQGELCPRCVPALHLVQQLSHHGTDPTVLAVQNGERGKPGFPLVPGGLRLRVANDPDTALQHAYGLTHEIGFAFVGSDGTIRAVIDHPASRNEISDALSTLD